MMAALRVIQIVALAVWVGSVVFFSFVTAPALFTALPRDMAGRATAAIFPRYYLLGWICGAAAIAALSIDALLRSAFSRRGALELVLLTLMMTASLYAGRVILPRAAQNRIILNDPARAAEQAVAKAEFDRLHARSVALNGMVLLLGLGGLILAALPPRPPAP